MDLAECKGIYVIAEQFEGKLRDVSFELLGQARILADTIGDEVGAILIGKDVKPLAQELIAHGAHKVFVYDDPKLEHYNTTAYAKVLCDFFEEEKANVFLVGATNIGRDLGPRVANTLKRALQLTARSSALTTTARPSYGLVRLSAATSWLKSFVKTTARRWVRFVRTFSKNRKLTPMQRVKLSKKKLKFPMLT